MGNRQCDGNAALQMSDQAFSFVVPGTLDSRIHTSESPCANEVSASSHASNNCANFLIFSQKSRSLSKKEFGDFCFLDREVQQWIIAVFFVFLALKRFVGEGVVI